MAGKGDLPRGSELVGADASDFERPGEVMLTISHPSSVERIFKPLRADEAAPRPMDQVGLILQRDPFHLVETGEGSAYVAADALGPDTLERMARAGKLAMGSGSPLFGGVKAEPVPDRPARNSWGFVQAKNRVGVDPVRRKDLASPAPRPVSPEAEERPLLLPPVAVNAESVVEVDGEEKAPAPAFPQWLVKGGESSPREIPKVDGRSSVEEPVEDRSPKASQKPGSPLPAQRAGSGRKTPVMVTVPTSGPASWASGKKGKAAKPKPAGVASGQGPGFELPSVPWLWGWVSLGLGVLTLPAALVLRGHGTRMDVSGYYRWEHDALALEVQERRERYEAAMQAHGDLKKLAEEDRALAELNRIAGVLDERGRK